MGDEALILKLYSAGFDDYSLLGPVDTARKHALALGELPRFGVPAPRCLGFAAEGDDAGLVMEKLAALPFIPVHRAEAARLLARLHTVQLSDLSPELADAVSHSTPNRGRIGEAPGEPPLRETTLQHGDYFSPNLAATPGRVHVLDWDLLALGDPMWDLAFLLKADSVKEDREGVDVEAVTLAYQNVRPFDSARLAWHLDCFEAYWRRRGQDD